MVFLLRHSLLGCRDIGYLGMVWLSSTISRIYSLSGCTTLCLHQTPEALRKVLFSPFTADILLLQTEIPPFPEWPNTTICKPCLCNCDYDRWAAAASWNHAAAALTYWQLQVAITGKTTGKEAGKPTLLLTFKSDSVMREVKNRTGKGRYFASPLLVSSTLLVECQTVIGVSLTHQVDLAWGRASLLSLFLLERDKKIALVLRSRQITEKFFLGNLVCCKYVRLSKVCYSSITWLVCTAELSLADSC